MNKIIQIESSSEHLHRAAMVASKKNLELIKIFLSSTDVVDRESAGSGISCGVCWGGVSQLGMGVDNGGATSEGKDIASRAKPELQA